MGEKMNDDNFRSFLKKKGKKDHVINGLVNGIYGFNEYMSERASSIMEATVKDLETYAEKLKDNEKELKRQMRALALYFEYNIRTDLQSLAKYIREERIAQKRKRFKVGDFRGVDEKHAWLLKAYGIVYVDEMIARGRTPTLRKELAQSTSIPLDNILEYVKLSVISRIGAIKSIRARLYVDAGYDTIDKFAEGDPAEMRQYLLKWVEDTGFDGIAPLLGELEYSIEKAKKIERLVEY